MNKVQGRIISTVLCLSLAGSLFLYGGRSVPASEEEIAAESAVVFEEAGPDDAEIAEETEIPDGGSEPETAEETETPDSEAEPETAEPETAEPEEEMEPEEEEDVSLENPSGEEVAAAIHEIIEASSELVFADREGIERLQEYISQTEDAYGRLPAEEQVILSGSIENLSHAAAAVDTLQGSMEQLEATGAVTIGAGAKENSWRYIDGVPVKYALEVVEEETIEVAEASADENLLTSEYDTETKPQGQLLTASVPEGEKARVILVDEGSVRKGIDVSEWQGVIDWQQVKDSGIEFAILRCGYGGDYIGQDDDMWLYNVKACERFGIPYGVYLYSHATTVEAVDSEIAHTLRLLEGHNPQLPVYYDMEENSQFLLGDAVMSKLADKYCSAIISAGYKAGIYGNTFGWNNYLTLVARNDNYFHWVAQWNPKGCTYGGRYEMWQNAVEPGVPGIKGSVDRDIWYGAFPEASSVTPAPSRITDAEPHIGYKSHVQTFGWEGSWIRDGSLSGTEGQSKRLEGIQIEIQNDADLGVEYRTHVQTYGWEPGWKSDGETSGTVGEGKRLEAIQIRLTGADADKYDVYYCVHAQHFGWLKWAKNGESAGTAGYGYRLEGIRIRLVKKGEAAPADLGSNTAAFSQSMIKYNTHVQTYGWQGWQYDGGMAGTTGQSKRLEGIHIQLANQPYSGSIEYRTHIQTYGWENGWSRDGAMSGTTGQSKRLEAIQIRLTGEMAQKYDVWYQTHVQRFGWTGWARNGESCGSAGYAFRLEGIRIMLVPKGSGAPGNTAHTFYQK